MLHAKPVNPSWRYYDCLSSRNEKKSKAWKWLDSPTSPNNYDRTLTYAKPRCHQAGFPVSGLTMRERVHDVRAVSVWIRLSSVMQKLTMLALPMFRSHERLQ
jgi:hypothetical protein